MPMSCTSCGTPYTRLHFTQPCASNPALISFLGFQKNSRIMDLSKALSKISNLLYHIRYLIKADYIFVYKALHNASNPSVMKRTWWYCYSLFRTLCCTMWLASRIRQALNRDRNRSFVSEQLGPIKKRRHLCDALHLLAIGYGMLTNIHTHTHIQQILK